MYCMRRYRVQEDSGIAIEVTGRGIGVFADCPSRIYNVVERGPDDTDCSKAMSRSFGVC